MPDIVHCRKRTCAWLRPCLTAIALTTAGSALSACAIEDLLSIWGELPHKLGQGLPEAQAQIRSPIPDFRQPGLDGYMGYTF